MFTNRHYVVPPQMRVLYVSSVLLVWTVILSWIKHKAWLSLPSLTSGLHFMYVANLTLHSVGHHFQLTAA